jgi:hypothetical protein
MCHYFDIIIRGIEAMEVHQDEFRSQRL